MSADMMQAKLPIMDNSPTLVQAIYIVALIHVQTLFHAQLGVSKVQVMRSLCQEIVVKQ